MQIASATRRFRRRSNPYLVVLCSPDCFAYILVWVVQRLQFVLLFHALKRRYANLWLVYPTRAAICGVLEDRAGSLIYILVAFIKVIVVSIRSFHARSLEHLQEVDGSHPRAPQGDRSPCWELDTKNPVDIVRGSQHHRECKQDHTLAAATTSLASSPCASKFARSWMTKTLRSH